MSVYNIAFELFFFTFQAVIRGATGGQDSDSESDLDMMEDEGFDDDYDSDFDFEQSLNENTLAIQRLSNDFDD